MSCYIDVSESDINSFIDSLQYLSSEIEERKNAAYKAAGEAGERLRVIIDCYEKSISAIDHDRYVCVCLRKENEEKIRRLQIAEDDRARAAGTAPEHIDDSVLHKIIETESYLENLRAKYVDIKNDCEEKDLIISENYDELEKNYKDIIDALSDLCSLAERAKTYVRNAVSMLDFSDGNFPYARLEINSELALVSTATTFRERSREIRKNVSDMVSAARDFRSDLDDDVSRASLKETAEIANETIVLADFYEKISSRLFAACDYLNGYLNVI